jgi:hypothetical protein
VDSEQPTDGGAAPWAEAVNMDRTESERRDYCVMFGRAVWAERAWRIHSERWLPCMFVEGETQGRDFVAELDAINGEPLA